MADQRPKNVPPIPPEIAKTKDANEIGRWLARQPQEVQNWYLWENPERQSENGGVQKSYNELEAAVMKERDQAFANGELLPGVNETGMGTSMGKDSRAEAIGAKGIGDVREVAGSVSQNPDDYKVNPTMDEGPGYELTDKIREFGAPTSLREQLQLDAIRQERSDTTGLDAQKGALNEYKNLYASGGLNAIDRARIAQSQAIRGAEARGAEGAVRADAEEQGRAGGRQSFLLRQQAQQRSTNQRAMDDLQTQALGLQRRDAILRAQGEIGNQVQTAQDIIDKFNTEDARAMRDDANRAQERTWDEGNRRESANIGTHNAAATAQFGSDVARSGQNADRKNTAEFYNKGPSGGARGMFRDMLAGAEAAAGQGSTAAALAAQLHVADQEADAAKHAATVSGFTGLAGGIGDFASAGLTKALDDDDD